MVRDVTFMKRAQRGWPITTHWFCQPEHLGFSEEKGFIETGTKQSVTYTLGREEQ